MILKQYIVKVAPFVAYVEATFDPPLTESDWRELLPPDDSLLAGWPRLGRFGPYRGGDSRKRFWQCVRCCDSL